MKWVVHTSGMSEFYGTWSGEKGPDGEEEVEETVEEITTTTTSTKQKRKTTTTVRIIFESSFLAPMVLFCVVAAYHKKVPYLATFVSERFNAKPFTPFPGVAVGIRFICCFLAY